ncbi:Stk1 family PASTA domain-containing Ser/Thr kinase [Mycolicibacterium sp. 050158]|uniref:Stk1 family PASTA domain-containing Ser/Thr kinase n=1 Tax=Mycolicibacterium sp. 050158 TaxID=3090602 RepID=UPI00299D7BC2|nr:Stk1 family PASTA domain-containing Ser/Thr kinase [Mycolicibacterium sp. 050158]MDX1888891.1 Stk1 family PASTA domain-containing Ser/Thr kinase [Mycolicibacterium sp. 050158]
MTIPRHLSDRYELGDVLGFGGMSEVYLARDLRLHRDVAVKVLRADWARDPDCYLRFRREAQHAAALNHPAIVAVYDTGTKDTVSGPLPYIVMEYVDGVTLRHVVQHDGPIVAHRAVEIVADVCQALEFSHQHGTIHRDVKPANIMIDTSGAIKVMDFGIARTLTDTGQRLTQTAAILGTAHYLSPEQARGENVDARSDVYSLSCVLYEALTGQPPFEGDSPVAVIYQHVREDPRPPSRCHGDISPELDAVVLKGLAKNPENRYQSAAQLRADLLRIIRGEVPEAPKVFTDAERTDLLASSRLDWQTKGASRSVTKSRRAVPALRWLSAAALVGVLAFAVTAAMGAFGNGNRAVRVPDLRGRSQQDAVAALQTLGFEIRGPMVEPDADVPSGHVIDTSPGANTALAGGDMITLNVSSGPEQGEVPDCSNLTADDCVRRLTDGRFGHVTQLPVASATVPRSMVVATIPSAGRPWPLEADVTVEVSTGPERRRIPDVSDQPADQASRSLYAAGFRVVLRTSVDSTHPRGDVISTDPPAGVDVSIRSAVTLRVSEGNQIVVPNLAGMTYVDVVPYLQGLGHVGPLLNGGDVPGGDADRNRVVRQTPPAGTTVNRDGTIVLGYGS